MNSIIYPTTNLKATEQLFIERGEGIYVFDNQGKRYIEGMAGLWCTALGYANREIIDAASEQMGKLAYSHLFGGKTHQVAIDLADRLSEMLPIKNARLFFGNSGSDANDTLIKLIRYYHSAIGQPEKRKIIARERSYHGVTIASAALTGLPVMHTGFDLPVDELGILRTDAPHFYRGALGQETEAEFVTRLVNNLEQLILREGPETIAAFIAEPITGASGVIVPPDGYYIQVQALLKTHGIAFWADEVITGFGRTGEDFGCTTMGIKPEMMTLAKQLSSAYMPISAAVIGGDYYDAMIDQSANLGVFGHGYTYSGHPVACAVALKVLEIFQRDNIFNHAAEMGEYFQQKLQNLQAHPLVGEVRGRGLLAAVELVANKTSGQAFDGSAVGAFAQTACQENGLIVRAVAGSSIAFCPPLVITREQIDEMIDCFVRALDSTLDYVVRERLLA